jgi:hypothetical protein
MINNTPSDADNIGRVVFLTRIIVASLAGGVLLFGLFVLVSQGIDLQAPLGLLTIVSIVLGFGAGVSCLFLPWIIAAAQIRQLAEQLGENARQEPDAQTRQQYANQFALAFQTKTIVGGALLEGAALLALVALMLEYHVASLIVAAVMLAGILSHLPTVEGTRDWVEQRLRRLDEMRSLLH